MTATAATAGDVPLKRPWLSGFENQLGLCVNAMHDSKVEHLKAPFPYPGGKSKVADDVWQRLGNVDNFIEPFCGTCAVLLRRPAEHFEDGYRVETINDRNHYLVNLWRCLAQGKSEEVATYADWPVTEADLHARHRWLVRSDESYAWKLLFAEDPHYCDPKIAGWWLHGICCWIGSGWCDGRGVGWNQIPRMGDDRDIGTGVNGRPQLADAFDIGRGVPVNPPPNPSEQLPRLGERNGLGIGVHPGGPREGTCAARREWLTDWMQRLADRLRLVRSCYGHWSRICDSESTLTRLGTTGVFLDPPYPTEQAGRAKKSRAGGLYATDKGADLNALRDEVLAWCRKWGGNPAIRVAVCGYEGDGYEALEAEGWTPFAWEASGGYGNQGQGGKGKAENAKRERIWYSPACVTPTVEPDLFNGID